MRRPFALLSCKPDGTPPKMLKQIRSMTILCACAALTLTSVAQQANAQNQPTSQSGNAPLTLKSGAELVLIPTVVTRKGQPVAGLKRENFVVEQDGNAQTIATFEEVSPATVGSRKKPNAPNAPATNVNNDAGPQALTLVVIDAINTPLTSQREARKKILGFIARNATPDQMLGIVQLTDKGVSLVQDFTTDSRRLIAALERVTGQSNRYNTVASPGVANQPTLSTAAAVRVDPQTQATVPVTAATAVVEQDKFDANLTQIDQTLANYVRAEAKAQEYSLAQVINATLEGFQQIAQGLAGYAGKKNVIWVSAGFIYPMDFAIFQNQRYLLDQYTRTMRMLSDANVAVYPVDVHGVQLNAGADATYTREDSWAGVDKYASFKDASKRIDTFRDFADRTGGRPYFVPGESEKAFEDIMEETRTYYMLGYYLDRTKAQNGWHKLKVHLKDADGKVQTRTGFFVTPPSSDPEQLRKADISVGMRSPFDYTAIPIEIEWMAQAAEGGKKKVPFVVRVLPQASVVGGEQPALNLEFVSVARKPSTEVAGQTSKTVSVKLKPEAVELIAREGISYKGMLQLEPGTYNVRFLVRDNLSGRMGSVESPVIVQ